MDNIQICLRQSLFIEGVLLWALVWNQATRTKKSIQKKCQTQGNVLPDGWVILQCYMGTINKTQDVSVWNINEEYHVSLSMVNIKINC